jgi:glutaredoxin
MDQEQIKLYGTASCPQCQGAKAWLERKNVPFEYIDVRKDAAGMNYLVERGLSTIPVIIWKDQCITGFSPKQIDKLIMEVMNNGNA